MADAGPLAFLEGEDLMLARLALKNQCLTVEQLSEAVSLLQAAKAGEARKGLGPLLVARGFLLPRQLAVLMKAGEFLVMKQAEVPFAKALVKSGVVGQDRIDRAVRMQGAHFKKDSTLKPLGDILVEEGDLSAKQREAILSRMERSRQKAGSGEAPPAAESTPKPDWSPGSGPVKRPPDSEVPDPAELARGKVAARDPSFEIIVSADHLHAYIRFKGKLNPEVRSGTILDLIKTSGVTYGVVDEGVLEWLLRFEGARENPAIIARGLPPKPSKDGAITYFFETVRQGAGAVEAGDRVDFKDRGKNPFVRKGDLVGERSLPVRGEKGIDVYGEAMAVSEPKDSLFTLGSGVELRDGGLRAFAKVDGRPDLSPYGKLSVFPELTISGDVSFETGNIDFEGNVTVQGVVQDGFSVRAGSLVANELAKAVIEVSGDVTVSGGILGTRIRSQGGGVKALHAYAATIHAAGDVIFSRGVVDSKIETSGRFACEGGKVIASSISAKNGVTAGQIGTDRSRPCTVTVGVENGPAHAEIEKLKTEIALLETRKKRWSAAIEKYGRLNEKVELEIGNLVQFQDRTSRSKASLEEKILEKRKANDAAQVAKAEAALQNLQTKLFNAEQEVEKLFARQDRMKAKLPSLTEKLRALEDGVCSKGDELKKIVDWIEANSGNPIVSVTGAIFSGTVIRGRYSTLACKSNYNAVTIKEAKSTDPETGRDVGFRMYVFDLRPGGK